MDEKARSVGKGLTTEAAKRLIEIVGCDLRLMDNEIEKLAVYVDDRKAIDAADVNQATGWVRGFDSYELDNALEKADLRECLIVLDNLFKAGEKPVDILREIVGFFRNILMAQTQLREKSADKKAIFKGIFPYVSEIYRKLYQEKYAGFFSLVEGIPESDLAGLLEELENVDVLIKSTDAEEQRLFEVFLYKYCRLRKNARITSKAWG
jgi:DNA polymerase III delta subunit